MKTIIIGGGPAGMLAAFAAAKENDETIILEKMERVREKT